MRASNKEMAFYNNDIDRVWQEGLPMRKWLSAIMTLIGFVIKGLQQDIHPDILECTRHHYIITIITTIGYYYYYY